MNEQTQKNVLVISTNFNYSCGVSKHIFLLLKELKKDNHFNFYFCVNSGDSLDRIKELGIPIYFFYYSTPVVNILSILPNFFKLLKYCIKYEIKIIHTHHRYPELLSFLVSKLLRIKTITTVHSLVDGKKIMSFKSDQIIAVSKAVEMHLLIDFGVNRLKLVQLYNFVEEIPNSTFSFPLSKQIQSIFEHNRIILFIGRIGYVKGCDVLMDSFLNISTNYSDVRLVLIGNIENEELKRYFLKSDKIIYIPSIDNASDFIRYAEFVVAPSRIEPLSYVMLESGLFSKPFIGGNTGGIREFIEHKVSGYLVKPGDVDSLSEAIVWLLNNKEVAKIMGQELYKRVLPLKSKDEYIKKLNVIYNE